MKTGTPPPDILTCASNGLKCPLLTRLTRLNVVEQLLLLIMWIGGGGAGKSPLQTADRIKVVETFSPEWGCPLSIPQPPLPLLKVQN